MQNGEKIGQIPDHRLSTSETSFRQNLLIKRYNTSTTDIITISKLYPRLLSQSELDQKEQDFQEYGQDIPGFIASEFIIHDPRILLLTSEKLKKQEEPRLRTIGITDPHRAIVRNPHLPFIPNKKFELFYHQVKRIGIPNGICMINADPRAIDYKPKIYKQGIYTLVNYKEHAKNRQDDIFSLTDAQ